MAPWEAFSMGVSYLTDISYGSVLIICSMVIIFIDLALKEKIGFGSILDTLLVGTFINLIQFANIIPKMENFALGILMLLCGQVLLCMGSYLTLSYPIL